MRSRERINTQSGAVFHSLFSLKEEVTEAEFLPAFEAFYGHLVTIGFAHCFRIMRRQSLDGFGKTLPDFEYHAELEFPSLTEDRACYEYVKKDEEPVRSLHRAVNSKVRRGSADFFLTMCLPHAAHGESVRHDDDPPPR
jgi:Family of unknown function (DUF6614)